MNKTFEERVEWCFKAFGKLIEMVPNQEAVYASLRRGCRTQEELDAVECFKEMTIRR